LPKPYIEGEGDYVLAVKGNQGHLLEDIQDLFELEFVQPVPFAKVQHDYYRTTEKDHGRLEIRECWTITEPDFLAYLRNYEAWAGLRTVALVRSKRRINNQQTVESRYYISSLAGQAKTMLHACRSHWGIENSLHWVLDVAFREDDSRMRQGHSPHNFAIVRQMALNLLRQETSCKRSIKGKRLKSGWDNNYLLKVVTSMNH
jgi:predicted transposase YbfD/YdcC